MPENEWRSLDDWLATADMELNATVNIKFMHAAAFFSVGQFFFSPFQWLYYIVVGPLLFFHYFPVPF